MNYLSGDKNKLGRKLSSRYLSSDAFTSSKSKTGGRSISKLGSLFSKHKTHARRFSGTGQRVGLFELKNIVLKLCFIFACIIVFLYTIPYTRYAMHSFFVRNIASYTNSYVISDQDDKSFTYKDERYVAPVFGQTDRFSIKTFSEDNFKNGTYVYAVPTDVLIGFVDIATSSVPQVVLFSEVGYKNNLFFKNNSSSQSSSQLTLSTSSTPNDFFEPIVFEGLGYGQMLAKIPPQMEVFIDTIIYARTLQGLKPVGRINYVEKDNGSTFTNVYAQILVAPYGVYKIKIGEGLN